ncbi:MULTISPECIES: hypothetical protein [Serratia]|uniref:hypothetical protein n=1 Tax=Serratia TaxID=613 RepID=UPI00111459C5|nr:hypothetical protein [Serratia marcescens]
MSIVKKVQSMFSSDTDAIRTAKQLPTAYIASIGVDFMDIQDPESDGDWLGLGDPLPLSSITEINTETGDFVFNYIVLSENPDVFEKFSTAMKVEEIDSGYVFYTAGESLSVPCNCDSSLLQPVINLAKRHSKKS